MKETHYNQKYIYRVQRGPTGKCLEAKLTIASTWCLFKLKGERIYLFFYFSPYLVVLCVR